MNNVQESIVSNGLQALTNAVKVFYLNEKAADVHFVFNSGERVPAHKLLLVTVNEVFDTMFYGSVPEAGDVKIVDASADAFKEFLKFFYFNEVQLTMENVGDIIYLGNKYDVAECMDLCETFLQSNITVDNVCQIYTLSIIHDRLELKRLCEAKISRHTEEVFRSADFLDCSKQILEHILKLNYLSCSEVDVFEACMSWVRNVSDQNELTRENVQRHLGNLFYEFRFRSMTSDEFADLLPLYESIFLDGQIHEIHQMIENDEYEPRLFNRNVRNPRAWNENASISCDRFIDYGRVNMIGNVDIIQFTASEDLLLGSVLCSQFFKNEGYFETNVPVKVTIAIVPDRILNGALQDKVIYIGRFELNYNSFTDIKFRMPIFIRAGFEYKIQLDLQQSGYNLWQLASAVQFGDGVNIQFHCDSHSGRNNKGLIRLLYFNQLTGRN